MGYLEARIAKPASDLGLADGTSGLELDRLRSARERAWGR
jgi:hypothetical protein